MHLFHLTCLFKRDRWKRCSAYAGTVSGAVTSATKYTKSSEEDPGAARSMAQSNVAMATLLFMPRGGFSHM